MVSRSPFLSALSACFIAGVFLSPLLGIAASVNDDPLYKLAKDFNDPTTWYLVGRKFYLGDEFPMDKEKAAMWFQKAANAGHTKAQWYLGRMYVSGEGIGKNITQAIKYLKQANDSGLEDASYDLGLVYLNEFGSKPDINSAVKWLTLAAQQENAKAAFLLGKLAVDGRIPKYSDTDTEKWLRLAMELGVDGAKEYWAKFNDKKQPSIETTPANSTRVEKASTAEPTPSEASTTVLAAHIRSLVTTDVNTTKEENAKLDSLVATALKGEAKAQYRLGMQLLLNDTSRELAIEWLRKASNQGHADATYQLGLCFRDGIAVQKSESKAIELFRIASVADTSSPDIAEKAASALNSLLINKDSSLLNHAVVVDKRSALDSLKRDAEYGRSEAQLRLANMYQDSPTTESGDTTKEEDVQPQITQDNEDSTSNSRASRLRCRRC